MTITSSALGTISRFVSMAVVLWRGVLISFIFCLNTYIPVYLRSWWFIFCKNRQPHVLNSLTTDCARVKWMVKTEVCSKNIGFIFVGVVSEAKLVSDLDRQRKSGSFAWFCWSVSRKLPCLKTAHSCDCYIPVSLFAIYQSGIGRTFERNSFGWRIVFIFLRWKF